MYDYHYLKVHSLIFLNFFTRLSFKTLTESSDEFLVLRGWHLATITKSGKTHVNMMAKPIIFHYKVNNLTTEKTFVQRYMGAKSPVGFPALDLLGGRPRCYVVTMFGDPGAPPVFLPAVTLTL